MRLFSGSLTLLGQFLLLQVSKAGKISNYNIDPNCPEEVITHEIRVSECDALPCTFYREKWYTVESDLEVLRNVTKPTMKCSTLYLGRHIEWNEPFCDYLTEGSCPLTTGNIYTMTWKFKVKYFVPPRTYTLYCSLVHDDGNNMICYYGAGRVV